MKKILLLIFILILNNFAMANPYTPGSQAWHNHNAMIWTEQDRIKAEREREAIRQQQLQQQLEQQNSKKSLEEKYEELKKQYGDDNPFPSEDVYAMILIDKSNGNVSWNLRFFENKRSDSDKIALHNMKYFFRSDFNYEPEQFAYFYFTLGETYAVARGQDKITKEWDVWVVAKGNRKISQKELEEEVIGFCNQEGYNCEVILSTTISPRLISVQ